MGFAVIGVNHRSCPIEIREKVSFTHGRLLECLQKLKYEKKLREIILLSTCHRSELYIYDEEIEKSIIKGIAFYESYFKTQSTEKEVIEKEVTEKEVTEKEAIDKEGIKPYLYIKQDEEAIRHLFEVAAGLDSIVIGEDQILGQVKTAHSDAMSEGACGKVLNKIFREAVSTAKQIKRDIKISEQPLSISHIAVKFLKEKQGTLEGKKALVIGTGKMNELTIKYLLEENIGEVYVTNRTHTKAVELTEIYDGLISVPYRKRYEMLPKMDIVISATASPHIILQANKMPALMKRLDIMDIAMPRDIEPAIHEMEFARVYDMEALGRIAEANNMRRLELVAVAQKEIEKATLKLMKWLEALNVEEVIQGLDLYCEEIKIHTTRVLSKKKVGEEIEEEAMHRIMTEALKRCMRKPIAKLMTIENPELRRQYAKMLSELFELY